MKTFQSLQEELELQLFSEALDSSPGWSKTESNDPPNRYDFLVTSKGNDYGIRLVRLSNKGVYRMEFGHVPSTNLKKGKVLKGDLRAVMSAGVEILSGIDAISSDVKAVAISLPNSITKSMVKLMDKVLRRKLMGEFKGVSLSNLETETDGSKEQYLFFHKKTLSPNIIKKIKAFREILGDRDLEDLTPEDLASIPTLRPDLPRFSKKIIFSSMDREVTFDVDHNLSQYDKKVGWVNAGETEDKLKKKKEKKVAELESKKEDIAMEERELQVSIQSETNDLFSIIKDDKNGNKIDAWLKLYVQRIAYSNPLDPILSFDNFKDGYITSNPMGLSAFGGGELREKVNDFIVKMSKDESFLEYFEKNLEPHFHKMRQKYQKIREKEAEILKTKTEISEVRKEVNINKLEEIPVDIDVVDVRDFGKNFKIRPEDYKTLLDVDLDKWEDEFFNKISEDERKSIYQYSGGHFVDINADLRFPNTYHLRTTSTNRMLNIFKNYTIPPLKKGVIVYRGTKLPKTMAQEFIDQSYKYDPAFLSTSFSPFYGSKEFGQEAGHETAAMLSEIYLPKGFNYGMPIRNHSEYDDEDEFLIGPGALFKVIGGVQTIRKWTDPTPIYKLKLLYVGNSFQDTLEKMDNLLVLEGLDKKPIMSYYQFMESYMTENKKPKYNPKNKFMGDMNFENGENSLDKKIDFHDFKKNKNSKKK